MRFTHLFLCTAIPVLSACSVTTVQAPEKKPSTLVNLPMTPVSISCAAHPGVAYIHAFYVKEPFSERMAGGLSCGGIGAFGYLLPNQWQPGMKVKVRWKPNARDWIEKTTTIRRYDEAGTLFVHFFVNDEVRVVSSGPYPESSLHPIHENVTIAPPEEE